MFMRHALLMTLTAAALASAGCGKKAASSSPKNAQAGPALPSAAGNAATKGATRAPAAAPAAIALPDTRGNGALQPGAPELQVTADRQASFKGGAGDTTTLPAAGADYRPSPVAALVDALKAVRKDGRILNAAIDATLGADALWGVVQSASRAGFTEVRVAVKSGGALAIHMPQVASAKAPLPRAGHLALFIGAKGANAKVFIGASGKVFPVASTAGGKHLTTVAGGCPAAPRPASGRIPPALVRTLGEPLCVANEKKDYSIVLSPSVSTTVGEAARLAAAAATPASGCSPQVALAAPAGDKALTYCGGALTTERMTTHIKKMSAAGNHSAVMAAARKPLLEAIDPSKRAEAIAPAMAAKLQGGKANSKGTVALGRIATSDNDVSRTMVTQAMKGHLAGVKRCYLDHVNAKAETGSPFSGALTMGTQITHEGKTNRPGFSKRGNPPEDLKLCIALKAQKWTFQAPAGGKPIQAMIPIIMRPPTAAK